MKLFLIIVSLWGLGARAYAQGLLFPRLLRAGFEEEEVGSLPAGWQAVQGQWQVGAEAGQRVLRQANGLLYDTALATYEWANYAMEAELRCAPGEGPWGLGLVGYWRDRNHHYRCCLVNDALHLVKVEGGRVTSLTQIRQGFSRGLWYRVRFLLRTTPQRVMLRGEVWPVGAQVPPVVLEAADAQPGRWPGGQIGLWTGHADSAFRHLTVTSLHPPDELYAESFQTLAKGHCPAHWTTWGGHWVGDVVEGQPVYRQMQEEAGLTFDDNALAVLEWRDYRLRARLKVEPQGETWGVGVVGYFRDVQNYYRLRFLRRQLRLFKRQNGEDRELAAVPFNMDRDCWYSWRFCLEEGRRGVWLRGKVWQEEVEPDSWTISVEDRDRPLSGGAVGFLTFLTAASFDDLEIAYNQPRLPG